MGSQGWSQGEGNKDLGEGDRKEGVWKSDQGLLSGWVEGGVAAPAFPLLSSLPTRNEALQPPFSHPWEGRRPGEARAQAEVLAVRTEGKKHRRAENFPKPRMQNLGGSWKQSILDWTVGKMFLGGLGELR